jgi:hypothetical protein
MIKLAHIINPVVVPQSSSLYFAQPVTFETMRRARDQAKMEVDISFFTAQYPEDLEIIPLDFSPTYNLERSILDFGEFKNPRKLPLLKDILDRLYAATDAEYLVYTNVDIALQSHFYIRIAEFIAAGHDAFTINRRTINGAYTSLEQLPEMHEDPGEPHRGWDCFIFRRDVYPKYILGNVCIGIPRADLVLLSNLQAYAKNFSEFRHEHLTFHIGNDRSWWGRPFLDYENHNTNEAIRILRTLEQTNGPFAPDSPPAAFLFFARNKLLWSSYQTILRYVHIPARYGRPLRFLMRNIRPWS